MPIDEETMRTVFLPPLLISRSRITTEGNRTGTWRFLRPAYAEGTAPCSAACPAGADIPRLAMLAARGRVLEAIDHILLENPFPSVCGRVCFHPCEGVCNRRELDSAVAIHELERFLGDTALSESLAPTPGPAGGRRVAIAGAGPAGLAAAYFLRILGHDCEIFEADREPGGVLRWGIPRYRLPGSVLAAEIGRIVGMGVRIHCQSPITEDFPDAAGKDYDAVVVGCGLGRSISLNIPGGDLADDGLAFLHQLRAEAVRSAPATAAVIGGGNTAIDVARSLVRLGTDVTVIYRRRAEDMPAFGHEVDAALAEGVRLETLGSPVRIEPSGDRLALTLARMRPEIREGDRRARVVPDGDRTETWTIDAVFTAIGAEPAAPWLIPSRSAPGRTDLDRLTLVNGTVPIVFGGDLTNPVGSVPDAVASGKGAAMALDTLFTRGPDEIAGRLAACRVGSGPALSMEIYRGGDRSRRGTEVVSADRINFDAFDLSPRLAAPTVAPEDRATDFSEVARTFDPASARTEAVRCFNCGICTDCDICFRFCPEMAIHRDGSGGGITGRWIHLDYCKGCGICVAECPRSAMRLEEETS